MGRGLALPNVAHQLVALRAVGPGPGAPGRRLILAVHALAAGGGQAGREEALHP